MIIRKEDNEIDSIFMPLERRLSMINDMRNVPSTERSPCGCFARHYVPNEQHDCFRAAKTLTVNSFSNIEAIEESLRNAIESMLVAGYREEEIIDSAMRMHMGLISRMKVKRLIFDIRKSRHYAVLCALIHE